jgi:flagellar biosynthetic protein FliR
MNFEALFGFNTQHWPIAYLTFMRVATILLFLPFFGATTTPVRTRILFALVFTFATWPIVEQKSIQMAPELITAAAGPVQMGIATLQEVFFGFAIGFSAKVLLFAANIAAETVGVNMGFQIASTFSPIFEQQESVFAVFKNWLILLALLSLNMHHYFIELIFRSFTLVPLSPSPNVQSLVATMTDIVQSSFELGLRIAAPVLALQIILTFSLGLLGRAIPQLNVFNGNFPLSYLASMIVLFFAVSSIITFISQKGITTEVQSTQRTLATFTEQK